MLVTNLQTHSTSRICTVLALSLFGTIFTLTAIKADASPPSSNLTAGLSDPLTHTLYLPSIYYEPTCMNPPSDTVAILGQATVHGNPAPPGIPFLLTYRPHWETPGTHILTMTTRSDGSFCSGPVSVLSYCHGMWYEIYEAGSGWWTQIVACESGKVYTVTAEISR